MIMRMPVKKFCVLQFEEQCTDCHLKEYGYFSSGESELDFESD